MSLKIKPIHVSWGKEPRRRVHLIFARVPQCSGRILLYTRMNAFLNKCINEIVKSFVGRTFSFMNLNNSQMDKCQPGMYPKAELRLSAFPFQPEWLSLTKGSREIPSQNNLFSEMWLSITFLNGVNKKFEVKAPILYLLLKMIFLTKLEQGRKRRGG